MSAPAPQLHAVEDGRTIASLRGCARQITWKPDALRLRRLRSVVLQAAIGRQRRKGVPHKLAVAVLVLAVTATVAVGWATVRHLRAGPASPRG